MAKQSVNVSGMLIERRLTPVENRSAVLLVDLINGGISILLRQQHEM
jgi:hypothetical protein